MRRLFFLDNSVDAVSLRRVEDPTAADPERDVVGAVRVAVADQVARE